MHGREQRPGSVQDRGRILRMESVHVLARVHGRDDRIFVMSGWQGNLHEDGVHGLVRVPLSDQADEVRVIRRGRETARVRDDAGFRARFLFQVHVDVRGRVVAHENGCREGFPVDALHGGDSKRKRAFCPKLGN